MRPAVLPDSPGIDPFLEDPAKSADRVFCFEEGPRDMPSLSEKTWLKMSQDSGSFLMISPFLAKSFTAKYLVPHFQTTPHVNPQKPNREVLRDNLTYT
jgi:hypothetical protein